MATVEEVATLRRITNEPGTDTYTDEALSGYVDAAGSVDGAAAVIWQEKAAAASKLVNVSESGSSRSMQQVYSNALDMAKFYENKDNTDEDLAFAPFTTPSVRP